MTTKDIKPITFQEAQNYKMVFGPYKGQKLSKIASTTKGILYLDNLHGTGDISNIAFPYIDTFMTEKSIVGQLIRAYDLQDGANEETPSEVYLG
jgi:hypothetical protein